MKPQLLLSLCFICNFGFLYGQASIIEQVSVKLTSQLEKPFAAAFYKDIPIGTLVLIKNPKNQKTVTFEITALSLNTTPLIEITPTGMSRLAIEEYDKVEIIYILDNNTVTNTPNIEQTTNANPFTNSPSAFTLKNPEQLYKISKNKFTQSKTKMIVLESKYLKNQKICFHRTLPIGNKVYIRRKGTENLFLATVVGRLQGKNIPADVTIQLPEAYFDEISNSSKEKIIDVDSFSELGDADLGLSLLYNEIANVFEEGICKASPSQLLLGSDKFALHKTAPIGTRILLEIIDNSNEDSRSNQNGYNNTLNPFRNSNEIKTSQIFAFEVIGKLEDTPENKNTVLVVGEQLFKNYDSSSEKSLPVKISYFEE